jgi:hypothetical protein
VNAALAQRLIALAGLALLAGILALALASGPTPALGPALPQSVPAPGGGWYQALASSHGPTFSQSHTNCGHALGPSSLGLAADLPCDVKIYLSYGDQEALTQVIARGVHSPVAQFELSPALAAKLGLKGTDELKWRYAR